VTIDGGFLIRKLTMEKKIRKIILLSYKNRFSIYYKPGHCLVKTYFKNGSQHKETGKTIAKALSKMIDFLSEKNSKIKS